MYTARSMTSSSVLLRSLGQRVRGEVAIKYGCETRRRPSAPVPRRRCLSTQRRAQTRLFLMVRAMVWTVQITRRKTGKPTSMTSTPMRSRAGQSAASLSRSGWPVTLVRRGQVVSKIMTLLAHDWSLSRGRLASGIKTAQRRGFC